MNIWEFCNSTNIELFKNNFLIFFVMNGRQEWLKFLCMGVEGEVLDCIPKTVSL